MGDISSDIIHDDKKMIEATESEVEADVTTSAAATTTTKKEEEEAQPAAGDDDDDDAVMAGGGDVTTFKKEATSAAAADNSATTTTTTATTSTTTDKSDEKTTTTTNAASTAVRNKELEKKYADWPMKGIQEPHENDVLFGRGGGTNHHPGNKKYRKIVEDRKLDYVNSKRLDKPLVALEIIRDWRNQVPPGRFLKMDDRTGLWNDVGDKKAREKTSQALREKAPLIRKQQEEEEKGKDGDDEHGFHDDDEEDDDYDEGDEVLVKTTRFAEGTNLDVKKAMLARDHSLGREYLDEGEAVTLDGFSWQDPFQSGTSSRTPSTSSSRPNSATNNNNKPSVRPPPPPPRSQSPPEAGSSGSDFCFPGHGSLGPPPPPPPPGAYAHMSSEHHHHDRHAYYSAHGRYENWGGYPPPPPPPPGYPVYPPPPHHHSSGSAGGSWPPYSHSPREHSLCDNPLPHASVSQPAPYPFGRSSGRSGGGGSSSSWGQPPPPHGYPPHPGPPPPYHHHPHHHPGVPPPPPPAYPPPPVAPTSHDPYSPIRRSSSGSVGGGPGVPPSPPYAVDPRVASAWSGQDPHEIAKSWSAGSSSDHEYGRIRSSASQGEGSLSPRAEASSSHAPRPDLVKRATSNQNETVETKPSLVGPSVKRAALNRDNSLASNLLKEKYVPGLRKSAGIAGSSPFNAERAMSQLTENMEQSTLETGKGSPFLLQPVLDVSESDDYSDTRKLNNNRMSYQRGEDEWSRPQHPKPLTRDERLSTIDLIAMDLMVKPLVLSGSARSTTIEALALDLEDDPWVRPEPVQRGRTMEEVFRELRDGVPKPNALSKMDRLTTSDFLDIVNEPLLDDDAEMFSSERDKPLTLSRETSLSGWV